MKKFGLILLGLLLVQLIIAEPLTLESARKLALNSNPDLLGQQEDNLSSKNMLWNSYLSLIPTASISAGYSLLDEEDIDMMTGERYDSSTNYGVQINQPIFNGGKIWLGSRIANDSYKISKHSLTAATLGTIAQVESKYFSVLENKALLEVTRKDMQTSIANVETAKIRYDSGSLSKADYLQFQAQNASKHVLLIQRETLYHTSLMELANFLQIAEVTVLQDIPIVNYSTNLKHLQDTDIIGAKQISERFVKQGQAESPNLKISEISVKTSEKSRLIAGGNLLPSVNLIYSKRWNKMDFEEDYNEGNGSLGVNFSMPIFPIVNNGLELVKANHNLKKAKYSYESGKDGVELNIRTSVLNLISVAKTVKSSELAREFSRETYDQMQERFRSGLITANDLLSAEVTYTTAQNQYTSSFYNYLRAKSSLMQLIGSTDDNVFNKLIK